MFINIINDRITYFGPCGVFIITEIIGINIETKLEFFFITSIILLFVVMTINMLLSNIWQKTKHDIGRQEICQRELLHVAKKSYKNSQKQLL